MPTTFANPSGGPFPLGKITVTTDGTPVALTVNTGSMKEGPLKMARRFQQVTVYAAKVNTGNLYIMFGNVSASANPNAILAQIPPGGSCSLPQGGLLINSKINLDQLFLDADVNGSIAYANAIYG
ncbi:MAG TPA: hypothetical protein VJY15_07685 [Candidatus Acidoferrum sp.]|nr:hypothetical protein [Candidatus Acidoferrum sp.]